MTLSAGKRLGTYEIISSLGAGGMGEVYRARDTKLGRDVALKVLPEAFSRDKERLARFEREARLLASLNHPNIAVIHGFEESDGVHFLVMELVEGETLAERIARGPIPLDEALPLFRQIAEALEAAHGKGVIHRDLKPANIKITPEGKIKVLDFGLAKSFESEVSDVDLSQSPTLVRDGTQAGVILGTAPYMSPEQARGKIVDKRADIWAFGCVLFEALTGRLAFPGQTLSDTIANVLKREPEWERLPEIIPIGIRTLLRRCLQKDPERRLRDAWDARLEIEEALSGPSEVISAGAVPATPEARWQRAIPWLALAFMTALALWFYSRSRPLEASRVVRTHLVPTEAPASWPSISPDGSRIVYVAGEVGERKLYSRHLDQEESSPIPGTEGAVDPPFFSPDGEWVGFVADGQLKKVRLDGVGAVTLATVLVSGASWGPDGDIVFGTRGGLMTIPADGGAPEALTTLDVDAGEQLHRWPQVMPNGEGVLFASYSGGSNDENSIFAQSLSTGERRFLTRGNNPRYVSTGHLVYARGKTLYAVPFDPDRLEVRGEGVPVQGGLMRLVNQHIFALSETGTLVYMPSRPTDRNVVLVDHEGQAERLALPVGAYNHVRFSPDGQQLALGTEDGKIHLYELEQERFSFLFDSFEDAEGRVWTPFAAVWSPDGTRFAVSALAPGTGLSYEVFIVSMDGQGSVEHLVPGPEGQGPRGWSRDGKSLLYQQNDEDGWHVWELPLEPKGAPRRLVAGSATTAIVSPDGRWLAYSSLESGRSEVFAKPYGSPGGGRQLSIDGGTGPVWSPDV